MGNEAGIEPEKFPLETERVRCRYCHAVIDYPIKPFPSKPLPSKLSIFFHTAVYLLGWYELVRCVLALITVK